MKLLALFTAFFIFSSFATAADNPFAKTVSWIDIPVEENRIASQDGIPYGCGFVAIYNALMIRGTEGQKIVDSLPGKTPTEKIEYIIRTYGAEQSSEYPRAKGQRETGIGCKDLLDIYNEVRERGGLPPLTGSFLEHGAHETQLALLTRLHGLFLNSLKQGEPPLISMHSTTSYWAPQVPDLLWFFLPGGINTGNILHWKVIMSHIVTITGISEAMNADGSFSVNYIDPLTGKKSQMLIYSDRRYYSGWKGNYQNAVWLQNRPFAVATGGSLDMGTSNQPRSARTEIYIQYGIYKE